MPDSVLHEGAATCRPKSREQEHHDLIASLVELPRLDDDFLEGLEQVLKESSRRLRPTIGPGTDGVIRRLELEFGMREASCGIPVASVEGLVSTRSISISACDIGYPESPAASRAFERSRKSSWRATKPRLNVKSWNTGLLTATPLPDPCPLC